MLLKLIFFNWGRWNIIPAELQIALEHGVLHKLPINTVQTAQDLPIFIIINKNDVQYIEGLFNTEIPANTFTVQSWNMPGTL